MLSTMRSPCWRTERPLSLKQDCSKAKDNKCSRAVKILEVLQLLNWKVDIIHE